jgi:hypothetical protein
MKLLDFSELCCEIGERAEKEFNIGKNIIIRKYA